MMGEHLRLFLRVSILERCALTGSELSILTIDK